MEDLYTKEEVVQFYDELLDSVVDTSFGIVIIKRSGDKFENILPLIQRSYSYVVLDVNSKVLFSSNDLPQQHPSDEAKTSGQFLDIFKELYPIEYAKHKVLKVAKKYTVNYIINEDFIVKEK